MKTKLLSTIALMLTLLFVGGTRAWAQQSELDQLKAAMQTMQKNMEDMQKKIADLEKEKTQAAAVTNNSPSVKTIEKAAAGEDIGHASPVAARPAMNDQQEGAQRPKDFTLDPKYRGFVPVPNTPALIKFNAKPRVDITSDSRNAGNPDRFATATIPVLGDPTYGGSRQFNVNARGSTLSFDVRAPDVPGDFRFYYNNDFFGSGSGMSYRLKQMYGQYYNVTAGFTYSCFEDPDAWPDTVDFEGPNSVIFARRALVRYMVPFADAWQFNVGVEAPSSEVDANSTADTITTFSRVPDTTMNFRWENAKLGHVQLGGVLREISARGPVVGSHNAVGWGLNLASSINVFQRDSFQTQVTYGHGIFRYINDDFINNDAAFDAAGNLHAIPCLALMAGYTHSWCESLRSTATYGYVDLDNEAAQGAGAYHYTHYASANLVWQIRKRLSIGLEALYGKKAVQGGATGDVWRIQTGIVYSLFD